MAIRSYLPSILLLPVIFLTSPLALAQTAASVTGVVTDGSGAIIPGVAVTLSNSATSVKLTATTDSAGSYRIGNVPPGPGYTILFKYQGFSPFEVNGLYVNVANARTQNAKLTPGVTVEVKVNSDATGVTLDTTDATIGNNFEVSKLQDLPVQDRTSPSVLFTLQPGITSSGATTGARTDQTDVTIDGLDVNDFATGNFKSITGNASVDAIQEFRGTTAGFNADSGPGGGAQFQLVTRSGSNAWHGSVSEYHRDNSTAANDWFNNNAGVGQPKLVRNQFGGSLGGPIKRDRLFFFFNFLGSRISQETEVERTVPLPSFAQGTVSYINSNPGCDDTARENTNPGCISSLSPAQVQAMDPAGIGASPQILALFKARYPAPNDLSYGDGINTAGFRFNSAEPDDLSNYTGRVDYIFNPRISFFGRGTVSRENEVDGSEQFPGDPPQDQFIDRSYAYVAGMNWAISSRKVNQFTYGSTVQDWDFARPSNPEGIYQYSFGTGFTTLLDSPYADPANAMSRHVPISQVNDSFNWTVGRHTLQMGGYFKWITSRENSELGYNSYGLGLGGHLFGLSPALEPADLLPSDGTAEVDFDSAYAAMLGRVASIAGTFNYDTSGQALPQPSGAQRKFIYYQLQPYFTDTWKVSPQLTLSYGVNYQYFTVPYEANGLETVQNTGFDQYFGAREAQSAAGQSGNTVVPFITYVLGGPKNHGPSYYAATPLNFAPRFAFAYNPKSTPGTVFNGSAGIVYDRTVINAVQYQQTQYSYLFQQNFTINNGNNSDPVGSIATDPRLSSSPTITPPATPKAPYTPWVTNGVPYGLIDGTFNAMIDPHLKTPYSMLFNFGMQHQFPGATILKINVVERLGRRLLAQADASQLVDFKDPASGESMSVAMAHIEQEVRAGADPTNLPAEPWFENQLAAGYDAGFPNATSAAAASNASLVQKGDFGDFIQALSPNLQPNVGMAAQYSENTVYTNKGFSSYSGLLVTLQKNLSRGLQFDFNYTWAHSIDNVSLIANGVAFGGYGFICDAANPRECRGNSDFDTAHYITSDFTYALPFGRGRAFGSGMPRMLDALAGGWDVSGIPSWHSGQVFSPLSNAFVAGFANDAPAIFNGDWSAVRRHVHKDATTGTLNLFADPVAAAAAFSGPVGLTIGSRNILRGPQFFNVDAGLAKNFTILESRGVHLQLRADAFNALNHPNFDDLDYSNYNNYTNITAPSNFGQLTAMANDGSPLHPGGPRVLQISGRLFF